MYLLVFISALINLSEIRAHASPYYDDINVICAIIGALAILVGFLLGIIRYLPKRIHESKISKDTKDTKIPVDNNKYSTDSEEIKKEAANQNTPRHYNPSTLPEYSERLKQFVTENRLDELKKALTYLEKHKFSKIRGKQSPRKEGDIEGLVKIWEFPVKIKKQKQKEVQKQKEEERRKKEQHLGRYEKGLQASNKAIEIDPQFAVAWNNKSNSLYNLGRYEEALQASNKAIEIDPQDALTWINKGNSLHNLGRYEEGLQACNKAIEIDPQDAMAWNNKGASLNKLGRQS